MLLEQDADSYLWSMEASANLPDRQHSKQKRELLLGELHRVRGMIKRNERVAHVIDNAKDAIYEAGESATSLLCKWFLDHRLTAWDIEHEFATWVLDDLIRWNEELSYEENMKDGKPRKHRAEYLEKVVTRWASINQITIPDCEISAVEGSPMLTFMQAAVDPVLAMTGETVGPERIKQIVSEIKKQDYLPASVTSDEET